MHEAEARVVEVARDIVTRYRHHLGPLGAQALVDAVDGLPAVLTTPDPAEAPTGILDLRDPKTIIPTQTIATSPSDVDPRTDPRNNLRPERGTDPRSDPRTDPRPDPRPRIGMAGLPAGESTARRVIRQADEARRSEGTSPAEVEAARLRDANREVTEPDEF